MTGELVLLAMKYDALLLVLEHRFYGTSVPYGNWETQNMLQHLTIEQALADIAEFRAYIVELLHVDEDRNKWIVFGCRYHYLHKGITADQLLWCDGELLQNSISRFITRCHRFFCSSATYGRLSTVFPSGCHWSLGAMYHLYVLVITLS